MPAPTHLRVFLSSPGDVTVERDLALKILLELGRRAWVRGRITIEVVSWDDPLAPVPLAATETPQLSVNKYGFLPSDCDLTIAILWGRLGTPIASPTRSDGTPYASGTEFEIEDARRAQKLVWIYRRTEKPRVEIDDADFEERRRQYETLKTFLSRLVSQNAAATGGVNDYGSSDDFEQLLSLHLELELTRRLDLIPQAGETNGSGPSRETDDELKKLLEQRKRLVLDQQGTTSIDQQIVQRKRLLRDRLDLGPGAELANGRFEINDFVGEGGYATVWKAYDHQRREAVAIKVLHPQYLQDGRRERFFRGASKMASLNHPGIVKVLMERGEDTGTAYFAMEYVGGRDLRKRVLDSSQGPLAAEPIVRGIASALGYAHDRGLIHRDIKPANVLLVDDQTPKLCDFDLVHATDTTGGTRTGAMGTFFYAAPEAMQDAGRVDLRADLYSLGKVWTFLLYGKELPPEAFANANVFIDALRCAEATKRLLKRLCAWHREQRPESVSAFLADLDAHSSQLPVRPKGTSLRFIGGKYQGGELVMPSGATWNIGRASDSDIVLVEEMVSRHHATLTYEANTLRIEDRGSTNGTFVNGERRSLAELSVGDRILIGSNILKVVEYDATIVPTAADSALGDGEGRVVRLPDATLSGRLQDVSVSDALSLLAKGKRTGMLIVEAPNAVGKVYVNRGDITHASIDDSERIPGPKALARMVAWSRGFFQFERKESVPERSSTLSVVDALVQAERLLRELSIAKVGLESHIRVAQIPAHLSNKSRAVLDAVQTHGEVEKVLNFSCADDLETATELGRLLAAGFVETATAPMPP